MRTITPALTPELEGHLKGKTVWQAEAFSVTTYRQLVEHIAKLAYLNSEVLLFFRGQDRDFQSKAGGSTLYPTIYRGDAIPSREIEYRFELLRQAGKLLVEAFAKQAIEGHRELRYKRYMQWAILQHYKVVATPLLDLTHSLRVACSFAQIDSTTPEAYVYVLGLPYITNRISINSEHDVVNVRLLSICPPDALRPYFQEGYLAGTSDVADEYDNKTDLDLRNRLIAKFSIPREQRFWGKGFTRIPRSVLYPRSDRIEDLCNELQLNIRVELNPGELGTFLAHWASLEERLVNKARLLTVRNLSVREAIKVLIDRRLVSDQIGTELDILRAFRNTVVHQPMSLRPQALGPWIDRLTDIEKRIHFDPS